MFRDYVQCPHCGTSNEVLVSEFLALFHECEFCHRQLGIAATLRRGEARIESPKKKNPFKLIQGGKSAD